MAPISTRRSQAGEGVAKKVHRKRVPPPRATSDSWELLEQEGLSSRRAEREDIEMQDENDSPVLDGPGDVDAAINPLREMAERVGKEVETFAERLDEFFDNFRTATNRFDAAHDLVLGFRSIAEKTVGELKEKHEAELRDLLKQEWREQANVSLAATTLQASRSNNEAALSAKKSEQIAQLRRFQQEVDIWELFRIMLELHPFESDARELRAEMEQNLDRLGPIHRYTSEDELWERFVNEDTLGKERFLIKKWLERVARHQASDVQGIVEELESKVGGGEGKGLWSSGWLYTRERIKGEKRLRSWPSAVDSPLPQIRRVDNQELLVTTLDPDAPKRQQRTLEKQDAYFEKAMWVACWEMLRRGKPMEEVCDWCEDRKEGWRAVVMGQSMTMDGQAGSSLLPTSSAAAWKHMCYLASQSGCSNDYEAAVFGLLGGNVKAIQKVAHTVDDHLYAYYSAALVRQFQQYVVDVCPEKALPQAWRRKFVDESNLDPQQAEQAIGNLINKLRIGSSTAKEATQPMKIIQSFLLADEVGSLVHTLGAAIAEIDALRGPENMIFLRDRQASRSRASMMPEAQVALDPQTLRIATHMSIVHHILSPDHLEGDELLQDENVLVAYIQSLRAAGKRDLIPLYASKLQRQRYIIVLGRILPDVTDADEQRHILSLMEQHGMDIVAILTEQLSWTMEQCLSGEQQKKPLRILERTEDTKLHPGQRIIVDFLSDEITADDQAVVRCLHWFLLHRGGWQVLFEALTLALRRCLVLGRFTCARMILREFPFEQTSFSKSFEEIQNSVNVMDETPINVSTQGDNALRLNIMRRQSRTYFELEQLVLAVESLNTWRNEEHDYISKAQKPSGVPSAIKKNKQKVSETMAPLLEGVLQNPVNEEEEDDLQYIRINYLPEVLIAYNTVLHAAGNLITRDSLLESMDLSVAIAGQTNDSDSKESNELTEIFVQSGRMRELVTSFALTSKAMLVLKAEGKPWKPRKDRDGKDLGIWEIASA